MSRDEGVYYLSFDGDFGCDFNWYIFMVSVFKEVPEETAGFFFL